VPPPRLGYLRPPRHDHCGVASPREEERKVRVLLTLMTASGGRGSRVVSILSHSLSLVQAFSR
jgi:hypothetical protein